jgi:hypothetical protein
MSAEYNVCAAECTINTLLVNSWQLACHRHCIIKLCVLRCVSCMQHH